MRKLEEEEEILRERLAGKEEVLRAGLKGWGDVSRVAKAMSWRSELSEKHVRLLAGEGVSGAAF